MLKERKRFPSCTQGGSALLLVTVEWFCVHMLDEFGEIGPEVGVQQQDEHSVPADCRREVALPRLPGYTEAFIEALGLTPDCHHYRASPVCCIFWPPADPTQCSPMSSTSSSYFAVLVFSWRGLHKSVGLAEHWDLGVILMRACLCGPVAICKPCTCIARCNASCDTMGFHKHQVFVLLLLGWGAMRGLYGSGVWPRLRFGV